MGKRRNVWVLQFVIPVVITVVLYLLTMYRFILPPLQEEIFKTKMDLTRQMALSVQSILISFREKVETGELTTEEAQKEAIEIIHSMRYGDDMKEYFWITDDRPDMIDHPYRQDLNGTYLGEFEDPAGKRLFKEITDLVEARDAGFLEYEWQKYDDPNHITSKIAYVILFPPWSWIIGTGIYLEDIEQEVNALFHQFTLITVVTLVGLILIMSVISLREGKLENDKMTETEEQMKAIEIFQVVFNNTDQLMGILDTDGTVLKANKKALNMIGKSDEEVLGKKFWLTPWWSHSEEEMNRVTKAIHRAAKGERTRFNTFHYRKGGEKAEIDISFSPIRDKNGDVRYILPEGRDISDQKTTEEKLKKLNIDLEHQVKERTKKLNEFLIDLEGTQKQLIQSEKMAALGRLVAGVAHEINTPLGISVTAASYLDEKTQEVKKLILEDNLTEEAFHDFLDTAIESTSMILSNLQRAASQIRVFKQVAVDQADEAIRTFMLKDYLLEIVKSLHPELKKKPCMIEIASPEELEITTYPGVISQIISNLIMNSLKHGFKNRDSGTITIECHKKEDHLIMDYQDNGQGIQEGMANKIFEPFYTTARNDGGTGLGLHIVYNLVIQRLKGSITINTQLESGLGFLIDFPVQ